MAAEVGFSEDGRARSGMGVDAADFDGDGHLDLALTAESVGVWILHGDGTTFTLGFGLFCHGAFHILRQFNVLNLDVFNVDAPLFRLRIHNTFDLAADFVAFAKQVVEINVASDVAQRGLRELAAGVDEILDLEHGFFVNTALDPGKKPG